MKRLHKLFERYFEEAKNLKNAYKSLPDELAIEMQQDLTAFYKREMELLSLKIEREFKTSKYYENYKSSEITPKDIKKPWYKRIFRKVKTYPNVPALEIIGRVDDEISLQRVSHMLTEQDEPDTVGEQSDGAGTADKFEAPAQGGERENPTEKPRRKRQRLKPTCQPPKLIEIETPLGRQIKLDIENGDNNG